MSQMKTKRNKDILNDYIDGMTQKEIGKKYNITQQMVSKLIKHMLYR